MLKILCNLNAEEAALRLLGAHLIRIVNDTEMHVRIVEVEAYDQDDPASHTFQGKTKRNQAMFGPAGHAYIYNIYGLHQCLNVTAGPVGYGEGVLIRAAEPLKGEDLMWQNRLGVTKKFELTNGPAKLTQALSIDMRLYGHDLTQEPLQLKLQKPLPGNQITQTNRIGVNKAKDLQRRFYITNSPFVSVAKK